LCLWRRGLGSHRGKVKVSTVDLNLLAVLDAILQTGSVGRAAERVGISKPAMSHALARLREQVGDPVLVRAGKQWQLTERALAMREQVHAVAEGARGVLQREAGFVPASAEREFTIHATDHVLALLGTEIGHAVGREAPGITLRFLPILPDDVSPMRAGDVDLALGVFPDLPPELRTQALFRERFACVVRQGHPLVDGKLTMKAFLSMKHVRVSPRGRAGGTVDAALAERGLSRRVSRHVPYFVVALDLVSRSDCVVTISERLAQHYASRFGLQVLRPPLTLPSYTIAQVWHPRVDRSPAHAWLRQVVVRAVAAVTRP